MVMPELTKDSPQLSTSGLTVHIGVSSSLAMQCLTVKDEGVMGDLVGILHLCNQLHDQAWDRPPAEGLLMLPTMR